MRNVFTNSELTHIWANQLQNSGRNSNGNVYFEGSTIYSYGSHFPIAKHIINEQGQRAVLFTERTYSNTTSKHTSHVWMSCKNDNIIFCANPNSSHEDNFNYWLNCARINGASKLKTAKKPELYLNYLDNVNTKVVKYAEFFGIDIPQNLQEVLSIKDKAEYLQYESKAIELAKIEKARKLKEQKREFKEQIKKWFNGELHRLSTNYRYDFLRIKENRIQTTQAVEIPLELGKRLYQSIKNDSLNVGDRVLNFSVNSVGKEIKIGCHTFNRSYLLRFGATL